MRRYAAGDDSVFTEVYAHLAPRLRGFCRRLSQHRTEADDLFQEALLRLHRARASYVPDAPLLPWALAIARSAHLDRLRYRRRRPEGPLEAGDEADSQTCRDSSPEDDASARDLTVVIDRALSRMSEKNRCAYVLLREEGLSVSAAAAALGTSGDVVKQRAHRAEGQVRSALRDAGWDGGAR